MSDIEILEVVNGISKNEKTGTSRSSGRKRKRKHSGLIENSEKMKGTETEFEEFVIDRTVTLQKKLTVTDVEKSEEIGNVSEWRKRVESTLLGAPPTLPTVNKAKKKECFNCNGEHNLYECKLPRDRRKIARRKEDALRKKQEKREMYHTGGIARQRLTMKTFVPGVLSDKLRSALGLRENDIPTHVYRMRRMGFVRGYPPGWLKKAIKTGAIKIFSSEFDSEDEGQPEKAPELDVSKLFWYPGFNEEDEKLEDLEQFKIPPKELFAQEHQNVLKNTFKRQLGNREKSGMKKVPETLRKMLRKFANDPGNDSDVIVVDTEGKEQKDVYNTPGEESSVVLLNGDSQDVPKEIPGSPKKIVGMGESMFSTVGTPTFNRVHLTPVASLDAFAVGIQPFEARLDETPAANKGNFRKLMDSLKTVRENNPPGTKTTEKGTMKKGNRGVGNEANEQNVIQIDSDGEMKREKRTKFKDDSDDDVIQIDSDEEMEEAQTVARITEAVRGETKSKALVSKSMKRRNQKKKKNGKKKKNF